MPKARTKTAPISTDEPIEVEISAELVETLGRLGSRAKLVRSYVRNVLERGATMEQWRRLNHSVPGHAVWTRPASAGGLFIGSKTDPNPDFRRAVDLYWEDLQRTKTEQHLREAAVAERKLQLAVSPAADAILKLADSGRNEMVRFQAAKYILSQRARAVDTADEIDWDDAEADQAGAGSE